MEKLVPTIGIEVHVELKSNAKIFSTAKNAYSNEPNTLVDIRDLGYPGTLPKLNLGVIHLALRAALACNCSINQHMHFDRKNYFYPDLPKGYQITEQDTPIGHDGYLEIKVNGEKKRIGIERIHMEEDTCKSIHTLEGTYLNYNRAGVPLIEIVSKPDMHSPEEAVAYVETLRETLLYLGISDVKIEEGSMRCDTNISLAPESSDTLGTKCEIKNIGSVAGVGNALRYEMERQRKILTSGDKVTPETLRFDDKSGKTIIMRVKETGNDYRYFPEPDIPYFNVPDEWIADEKNNMPVLPAELRIRYDKLGINQNNIATMISNIDLSKFLSSIEDRVDVVTAVNLLTGDVLSYLNKNHIILDDLHLDAEHFITLVNLISSGKLSSKQTKEVLPIMLSNNEDPTKIMKNLGMEQISDAGALTEIVKKVITDNPASVADYKAGKDRAIKYLMGQIMKETKGQANPKLVNDLLKEELDRQN
jgi:aspartyl-tRNA(Asn)/glutamyl-tRNA(Gln) amidotransferase subunit B